jgi:hypothetical protein
MMQPPDRTRDGWIGTRPSRSAVVFFDPEASRLVNLEKTG